MNESYTQRLSHSIPPHPWVLLHPTFSAFGPSPKSCSCCCPQWVPSIVSVDQSGLAVVQDTAYKVCLKRKMHHCAGINAIVTSSWDYRKFAHKGHLFHFDGFSQIKFFIVGSSVFLRAVKSDYVGPGKSLPVVNEDLHGGYIPQVLVAIHAYVNVEQGNSWSSMCIFQWCLSGHLRGRKKKLSNTEATKT